MPSRSGTLGVVVARRKSKRLPDKVLRPLLGAPLVAWCIRAALASSLERVIISTEDAEIAETAKRYGAEVLFLRPAALAEDFAEDQDIVLHALDAADRHAGRTHHTVVLLQATTPFVTAADIDRCLDRLHGGDAGCVFTVRKVSEPPDWMFTVTEDMRAEPFRAGPLEKERQHAQKLPRYFLPNGAAYAMRAEALREQKRVYCEPLSCVEMAAARSVDIDEELDLVVAEAVGRHFGFALTPRASLV